MYHYIYKTTCIITKRYYYGMHSTDNIDDGYLGSGKLLSRSLKKYGVENHRKEILLYCPSRAELCRSERQIVNESLLSDPLCMNLKIGGDGGGQSGIKRSSVTRKRMQSARRKLIASGWKMPDTSINKMRSKLQGRRHTDETKHKMSKARKGRGMPPFSDEHKAKLSAARRKRVITDETRSRISASMRNNPNNHGWKLSPTSRAKQVDSVRAALTCVPKEKILCPWCGKSGGKLAMTRFHLDNCKKKES